MNMEFRPATKESAKLRAAVFGPSGSGKTFSSLRLATGLGGKSRLGCRQHALVKTVFPLHQQRSVAAVQGFCSRCERWRYGDKGGNHYLFHMVNLGRAGSRSAGVRLSLAPLQHQTLGSCVTVGS